MLVISLRYLSKLCLHNTQGIIIKCQLTWRDCTEALETLKELLPDTKDITMTFSINKDWIEQQTKKIDAKLNYEIDHSPAIQSKITDPKYQIIHCVFTPHSILTSDRSPLSYLFGRPRDIYISLQGI